MKTIIGLTALALLLAAPPAHAKAKKVRVVTTLSVLAAVARDVGGDAVSVEALASPKRDPHTLVAKPTYKIAAKEADLFIELGLDLDKWSYAVVDASGNPDIQLGQPARVVASQGIRTKELPETLSKAWGDIHPYGNPHVWLDPVNVKQIARNIHDGLVRVDPGHEKEYDENLKRFEHRVDVALYGQELLDEYGSSKLERLSSRGRLMDYLSRKGTTDKLGGWMKKAMPLRGLKIVTYHKTWIYFCERFGLEIVGEIEEKPGIPPSQTYLHGLIDLINERGVKVLFIDSFYPVKDGDYLAKKTSAKVVSNPIDVGGAKGTGDYFQLIDYVLDTTLAAAK